MSGARAFIAGRLLRDRRGATAVEFAIVAPVMIFMIMCAIEFGHMAMARTSLEGAISVAARASMAELALTEDERYARIENTVRRRMADYAIVAGRDIAISTKTFRNFGSAYPEPFEDVNGNGIWDPANGTQAAEPFDDRNRNGVRDTAQQLTSRLGGPGDVVMYSATFPADFLFPVFRAKFERPDGLTLSATAILRNEPEARRAPTAG